MTRIVIDHLVVDGLPHLNERELRRHLQQELGVAFADDATLSETLGRPGLLQGTEDTGAFAKGLAAWLKEALLER